MTTTERLRELERAATAGPWVWTITDTKTKDEMIKWLLKATEYHESPVLHGCGAVNHPHTIMGDDPERPVRMATPATTGNGPASEANAQLIAATRNALPSMLAVIEAAEKLRRAECCHLTDTASAMLEAERMKLRHKLDTALAAFREVRE